jgi:hypothetical protein
VSTALGVASVSFVLVDLLNNGLIDHNIASNIGNDVLVSALSPDRIDSSQQSNGAKSQLNLFLYNITQNQGWRNVGYPSRNSNGDRIDNPPLAINLHYLLTAYGVEQFHAEILLGYAMQLFHETPFLPRDAIRKSLAAPSLVGAGQGLAPYMSNLFSSELAEQVEQIKIWPETLSTEEISRLWTAFQAKYRPTAAYQVSVVLIESRASTKSALPVLTRNIQAIPLRNPVIDQVLSQKNAASPADPDQMILPGYNLVLQGNSLKGQSTTFVIISGTAIIPPAATLKDTSITVPLPSSLLPGQQGAIVQQSVTYGTSGVLYPGFESNQVTFLLHPTILSVAAANTQGGGSNPRSGDLLLTVNPPIGPNQNVQIALNQYLTGSPPADEPLAYTIQVPPRVLLQSPPSSPPPPSPNIQASFDGILPGTYVVRIQVDGADSPLGVDANGFFATPQVNIP